MFSSEYLQLFHILYSITIMQKLHMLEILSNVKHIQQKKYHAFFCRNYMFTAFDPRKNNFFCLQKY